MEGREQFETELRLLGYKPEERRDARTVFRYIVMAGRFIGTEIFLGFVAPPEFPRIPPSGPHLSPCLFPLNPSADSHPGRVAASDFGSDWQYLSRPYTNWGKDGRTVKAYLAFINHLFATM